jgi:hypothetical protein
MFTVSLLITFLNIANGRLVQYIENFVTSYIHLNSCYGKEQLTVSSVSHFGICTCINNSISNSIMLHYTNLISTLFCKVTSHLSFLFSQMYKCGKMPTNITLLVSVWDGGVVQHCLAQ